MPTLLLSRRCQPEAGRLADQAQAAGWQVQSLSFQHVPRRIYGRQFAFYGETNVGRRLMRQHRLTLIEPTFDLLAKTPLRYTQRRVRAMTLGHAIALEERMFVKPADCTHKCFDAAVAESGRWIHCADSVPRTTPVLVSEPVDWENEYRAIVCERRVAALSPYIRRGRLARVGGDQWPWDPGESQEVRAFVEAVLADPGVKLPPVVTLDVGQIAGRGWAIVEFNPVWCSGLLGCTLDRMLEVLERACRPSSRLGRDRLWTVER